MSETKTCPRCGAAIRPDETPAGLCAACLMKMGFDSRSGAAEVVLTESERAERSPAPTIAELAPHFPELEIVELVGRGGMGAVYRAKQRSLDRDVALKILTVGTDDATFADRFQREARTLASLSHPGITAVFDFGQRGPWSFLAMEFVEGASLRQMLRARELGSRDSLAIVSQMCDALQYAHDKGVVHRDIKPENVLVTRDGRVKVLDFGLAKLVGTAQRDNLTQAKQVMGTPHYMAPEQWERPLTVDHRADIYALGVVFYELLTGELPIGRFAPPSHKVAVDVRLDDVVLRSLEKEPDRRYQHASQVKEEVAGITSTPGGVPPALPFAPERKTRSTAHKWIIAGSVLGCLVLLLIPAGLIAYVLLPRNTAATVSEHVMDDADLSPAPFVRLGLSSSELTSRTSLEIDEVMADSLGIPADRRPELNQELDRVWREYLDQEDRNARHTWLGPNVVELAWQAPVQASKYLDMARSAISRATVASSSTDSAHQRLLAFCSRQMIFTEPWSSLELSMQGESVQVKRKQYVGGGLPSIEELRIETPPSATVQRLWNRATAYRDHFESNPAAPETLVIDAATAAELGISDPLLSELNRDLAKAWALYLDWETYRLRVGWKSADVALADGFDESGFRQAEMAIAKVTPRSEAPDSTFQKLARLVRTHMRFGEMAVRFEFAIRDGVAHVRRIQYRGGSVPDIVEDTKESPPSPAMERAWNRANAQRNHFQQRMWDRAVADRDGPPVGGVDLQAQTIERELRQLELEITALSEQMGRFKPQNPKFIRLSEELDQKRARRTELQRIVTKSRTEKATVDNPDRTLNQKQVEDPK